MCNHDGTNGIPYFYYIPLSNVDSPNGEAEIGEQSKLVDTKVERTELDRKADFRKQPATWARGNIGGAHLQSDEFATGLMKRASCLTLFRPPAEAVTRVWFGKCPEPEVRVECEDITICVRLPEAAAFKRQTLPCFVHIDNYIDINIFGFYHFL
ncbi:hypothetical protein DPMN_162006 [Dreissena polymorpha]|uniref:Uncharacterized protein n=1 Tax=Dreissena polymorpha TaxID=45954 RepID=A0A9D4IRL9_DREPO|nr:hypothetical protein DPMN_162006 [Dreissena polymorpha]